MLLGNFVGYWRTDGGAAVRKRPPAAALSCSCERGYAPGETVSDPQVFDAEQLYEELSKIWNR